MTAAIYWVWYFCWSTIDTLKTVREESGTQVNWLAQSHVASKWKAEMCSQICWAVLILFLTLQSPDSLKLSEKEGWGWLSVHTEGLLSVVRATAASGTPSHGQVLTRSWHLLASPLAASQLPVTHSFCFLITLPCIWFWLFVASTLPPGTLAVSAPFLTGIFWIKFPRVRIWLAPLIFSVPAMS